MKKPSKKVISTMILMGAFAIAMITSDALEKRALAKKNNPTESNIEAVEVEKAAKNQTLESFFASQVEKGNESSNSLQLTPETVTEFALSELFSNYQNLKNQNIATPQNLDTLTTNLAQQTKIYSTIPTKYSILEINTFPDYQKEKSHVYGNDFGYIVEKYFKQQFFIEEEDSLEYIKAYADIRIKQAEELSKVDVPRSISDEHLEYINNLNTIGIALVEIEELDNDPILTNLIVAQYDNARLRNTEILMELSDYFIKNDIIFSDDEPGTLWNNF